MTKIRFLPFLLESKYDQFVGELTKLTLKEITAFLKQFQFKTKEIIQQKQIPLEKVKEELVHSFLDKPTTRQLDITNIINSVVLNLSFSHFSSLSGHTSPNKKIIILNIKFPMNEILKSTLHFLQTGELIKFINFSTLNTEIKSALAHEIIHIDQLKGSLAPDYKGPISEKAKDLRNALSELNKLTDVNFENLSPLENIQIELSTLKYVNNYFLSEHEKEAYLAGFYRLAKIEKKPFSKIVINGIDNILKQYLNYFNNRYQLAPSEKAEKILIICQKELLRIFISFFQAMIYLVHYQYPKAQINQQDIVAFEQKYLSVYKKL